MVTRPEEGTLLAVDVGNTNTVLGLYEGDRLRADTTTLDDFWPLFHAITVGVWITFVAIRLTDGFAAAAPTLARALEHLLALDLSDEDGRRWLSPGPP